MRRLGVTLAALLLAGLIIASPAAAQSPFGSTVAGDYVVSAGTAAASPPGGSSSTITIGSPRTILDFSTFDLAAGETLNLEFAARSDSVLIRVDSGVATLSGVMDATVGGVPGGNVWLSAPAGVTFGPTVDIDVGGLHASGGSIANADFVDDGTFNFTGVSGQVSIQGSGTTDPQIRSHGGPLGFVGQGVAQGVGSVVGASPYDGVTASDADSEAIYGAMGAYALTLSVVANNDHDLLALVPAAAATGTSPGSIDLAGGTWAGDVFIASRGTSPVTVNGFASGMRAAELGGDTTVSVGGGVSRADPLADPTASRASGAAPQALNINGGLNGNGLVLARATDDITVLAAEAGDTLPARMSGEKVALATDADFVNHRGSGAILSPSPWVIYSASPTGLVPGGLDSTTQALWNRGIDDVGPRDTVLGSKRYVFAFQPTLTFTSLGVTKTWDQNVATTIDAAYTKSGLHLGVPSAFAADTDSSAFTGEPDLSSTAEASGSELVNDTPAADDGPYPITIEEGTLDADESGYGLAFQSAGLLDVAPVSGDDPPVVEPVVTGTLGTNGWHTSNVGGDWNVTDPDVGDTPAETDCGPTTVTSDTSGASFTCTAIARGRRVRRTTTVKRDTTPPVAAASATSGGAQYTEGATASSDVQVRFTCTDAISGVANPPAATITAEGETPLVPGACTDNAGNTARTWFGPVRISRPRPPAGVATTPPPSAPPALPSASQTRTALSRQLTAALTTLRKLGLARFAARGYTRQFAADQAGVAIEETLGATRGARPAATKPVVFARGTTRFTAAGKKKIAVKLTKAGKRALRRKKSFKLIVRVTFRPASGAKPIAVSRSATVRRR